MLIKPAFFTFLTLFTFYFVSINASADILRKRHFGIAIIDTPAQSFNDALKDAKRMGSDHVELVIGWDDVEATQNWLFKHPDWARMANDLYAKEEMSVALSFLSVDTVTDRRPSFYKNKSWDNPDVIEGAWAALSLTLSKLNDVELLPISLGNEADIWIDAHPEQKDSYRRFMAALRDLVHKNFPEIQVGVKVSASSVLSAEGETAQELSRDMDVVLLTYYPLTEEFKARSLESAAQDLKKIVAAFPRRDIHLTEVGYPSSEVCDSSQDQQAAFVRQVFQAWDIYSKHIVCINWTWQTDIPKSQAKDMAFGFGVQTLCFEEFLGTLGLRHVTAEPKKAWGVLQQELRHRNFVKQP